MAEDAASAVVERIDLSPEQLEAVREGGNLWMGAGADALGGVVGQPVRIAPPEVTRPAGDDELPGLQGPCVRVSMPFTGAVAGESLVLVPASMAAAVADLIGGGDGTSPPETLEDQHLEAWGKALSALAESAGPALSVAAGSEVSVSAGAPEALDAPPTVADLPPLVGGGEDCVVLTFGISIGSVAEGSLVQVISPKTAQAAAAAMADMGPGGAQGTAKAEFAPLTPGAQTGSEAGIDMLLDIDLPVTVELGRAEMRIRDVLKLGSGSIVALDRLAGEPVDVVVNGKLVATGEVVVIDENFGVRITSVVSAEDRIRNLR